MLFDIWISIRAISKRNEYKSNILSLQDSHDLFINGMKDAYLNTIKYDNSKIQISDSAKCILEDIFNTGRNTKLVFRIDFPYCDNCVSPAIKKLANNNIGFKKEDIIILTSFPNMEYGNDFYEAIIDYNIEVMNIPFIEFNLTNCESTCSFLFIMDSQYSESRFLFINKYSSSIIDEYLTLCKDIIY